MAAEIILPAILGPVMETLTSAAIKKLARYKGIQKPLDKWEGLLSQMQKVLYDADQKEITDESVKRWLDDLRHLVYDIDDVLDDLATKAMHRQFTDESGGSRSMVRKIIPTCCTSFSENARMHDKLSIITTKLKNLEMVKNTLGLTVKDGKSNKSKKSNRGLEGSLVDPSSIIVGRQGEKKALLHKLLEDEPSQRYFTIVPIVGMGGVGKTTLARLLYNEVKDRFDLHAWVCVSDEFDIVKITKTIFQSVTGENKEFADLNLLQVALQEKLSKKRFLLVLDDVWTESYEDWKRLEPPFFAGQAGSKIIMTTRKSRLLTQLGYDQPDNLNTLSDEDALSLFCQNALGEHNFDLHPTLKPHGEAIVKKCDGLPLALIAIGRLLRTKANEEWKELLDSEIWTLRHKSEIAPALIVSYHDLPAYLKQLFAYCSLFPKDYLFDKDELVLLWMAEGFLHQQHGMERLGRSHFNELLTRSFFQHAPNSESLYVMHDLMNDLAESVAGDFSFRFDNEMEANVKKEALEKHRHMSFVRSKFEVYSRFKVFERSRSLRTFLAVSVGTLTGWEEFYLSNKILVELLPQLPLLRVLSLSEYKISEVPESIISLKHLRYLNLSRTRIAHLPEQVGNLYNLQTLLVCGCHMLKNLPTSFFNLKNLRHLDINDTPLLKKMPLGISELKSLQTLPKFIIEGGNGFAITELKDLKDLHGRLHLKGLDKVKSATDAKHANLLEEIDDLEMEWSDVLDGARNEALEGEVLNMLKPRHDIEGEVLNMLKPRHDKLKKLRIEYYGGIGFPSWVGDTSFCRLEHVTISGCKNCTSLPPLGQLPLLKNLLVEGMHGVKVVGSEFLGDCKNCGGDAFPSLENLSFVDMQGWEVWSINSRAFPRIRHLRIEGCRNLVEASLEALPSLRLLETNGCGYGVLRSIVHAASSITTLDIGKISGLTQLHGVIECLGAVEDLNIFECNELRYVWDSEVEAFKILVNLRCLDVRECSNLVGLGEKEDVHCGSSPTSLKEIEIYNCEKLERFKCPNSVEKLQVWQCCNLVSLDVHCGSSLTSLREMSVNGCGKLENFSCPNSIEELMIDDCGSVASISFPTGGQKLKKLIILGLDKLPEVFLNNNNFSSLERLDICWWPNLKSFPDLGYPVHLTTLAIDGCKNLKSFSDLSCFLHITSLSIIDCENLKSFPDDQLLSLTSLTDLAIRGCPNMEESFPRGFWPPNLSDLEIGGLKKPISKWGPQNFPTSLVTLNLLGEDVDSSSQFSHDLLPSSLLYLKIDGFKKLESISNGLQHLTSLQRLSIWRCPMLTDLPMFPQLLELDIIECPKLKERCSRSRRGSCWPRISHIPKVLIDCELWSEHEEA